MRNFTLLLLFMALTWSMSAQDHTIIASGLIFSPNNLTIEVGETVQWRNESGVHNVNGTLATFPDNPEGFTSGSPATAPWTYEFTFTQAGVYEYQCDPHAGLGMTGTITVQSGAASPALIITGIIDAQPQGAGVKAIELKAIDSIPDLSLYGISSANNGGGTTDSAEFTFPAIALDAGSCIFVAANLEDYFDYFYFALSPVFESNAANINGDDAIELFYEGNVIDVFGDVDASGTGTAWEYTDGWAYRKSGAGHNGGNFSSANWDFSGANALDNVATHNDADVPYPICRYIDYVPTVPVSAHPYLGATDQETAVDLKVLSNDNLPTQLANFGILVDAQYGEVVANSNGTVTYTPEGTVCDSLDFFVYQICDINGECEAGVTLVYVTCVESYRSVDIATITADSDGDFYADSMGGAYKVTAIVHGPNYNPNGLQFTIIDGTGEGVGVYNGGEDFGYVVAEGDEVTVWGTLDEFNGLTQIVADSVVLISADNPLDNYEVVSELNESTESQLVRIENVLVLESNGSGSSTNYTVQLENGTEETVRFDGDLNLNDMEVGQRYSITGIGGQFDGSDPKDSGYQLLPRYNEDVMLISSTINPKLAQYIHIFPNPTVDVLNLDASVVIDQVVLTDAMGRQLITWETPNTSLDVSQLANGMYFLRFTTPEGAFALSFVKH